MANAAGAEARRYHERTKHSFESVRRGMRGLDWQARPEPFKRYRGGGEAPLPEELPRPDVPALAALAAADGAHGAGLTYDHLARTLRFGAGVVRTRSVGGEQYHFRAYASAGALYPIEVYVACGELPPLPAGLHHFEPLRPGLTRLRSGDVRGAVAAAAAGGADAEAFLVLAGITWRSAWKYEARGYRHVWWDAGTMLANMLALAGSAGLAPRLLTGFADADLNRLLGVDGTREAALAVVALGRRERPGDTPGEEALRAALEAPLEAEAPPPPAREMRYPEAEAAHAASALATADDVRAHREAARQLAAAGSDPGQAAPDVALSSEPLETVIRRRGSARDYGPDPLPAGELAAILDRAIAPVAADVPRLTDLNLAANAIDGIEPGVHRYDGGFKLVRAGDLRAEAGYACLEQELGARAAATIFVTADLSPLLAALGDRGYRAAQLDAGVRAGRIYLAAYAQGLGATGLTFYDDEVSSFIERPEASPMMCVTVGVDPRRPSLRRVRRALTAR